MKLFSRVGEPFYHYKLEKQEWKKGERLDGFTIPFHVFDCVHGLFRRFSLWQSSNGVCQPGIVHVPRIKLHNTVYNKNPILVGDQVQCEDGTMNVTYSENQYRKETGIWVCNVFFGFLPEPQVPDLEPKPLDLLQNYCDVDETITQTFFDFFERFFKDILPLCQVATQLGLQNIVHTLAMPQFSVIVQQYKNELSQKLRDSREKLWH